jgi:ABC-type oligopeptide transport system substrate-binding subunit
MRGLPRARWIAGAAVLALAVTACGSGDDGEGSKNTDTPGSTTSSEASQGGVFRVYLGEPAFLLPPQTNETEGGKVLSTLYSPLLDYNVDTGDPYPVVAADMPTSDDNKTWTIKIADGWTFTNGEKVTAKSFVDSWNYAALGENATNNGYFFGPGMADVVGYADLQSSDPDGDGPEVAPPAKATEMSGLKAVDDSTIEVTLSQPFSQFPLMLGYTAFYPMAEECLQDINACNEAPIGNGPFKIEGSWNHNQSIKVVRNDDWNQDKKANLDEIDFQIYSDPDTGYLDLQAGNLDYAGVPSQEIANARTEFGDHFIDQASPSFTYIGYPLWNPTFGGTADDNYGGQAKADLRHALSMAINRQELIDTIFDGAFTPADSLVSPVVQGYREGACGEFCTYDVDKAKALWDSSGGVPGNSINLWFNAGAGHDEWMTAVGNYWSTAFGVNYKLQERPWAEYLDAQGNHQLDGPFRLGWVMDYPSAQNFIAPIYGEGAGEGNFGYNNPEANELMTKANTAATLEEGIEFYNQAEDLILADFPNIPMWFGRVLAAYSDNVESIKVDKFGNPDYANVSVKG